MIKIYFSSNTDKNIIPEIDLSGNEKDFTELNKTLRKFLASENQQIKIEVDTEAISFPYENMLKNLIVLKNNNPVLISVIDKKDLKIEGSVEGLDVFISNVEFVKDGYHIHYEYYEGNEWILPDSIPLIISSKE